MNKVKIFIQARTGSTRLPNKVLMKVMGKSILEYVIERAGKARGIEQVIVATSKKKEDSEIVSLCKNINIKVFCGFEDDVLGRFYQAAKEFDASHIVRITADCPFIDPGIIDVVIEKYFNSSADYCSNILKETFPDGEDVEVFSFNALASAWRNASLGSEREHVTPYIRKRPQEFKLANVENSINLSSKRWTLDQKEDFEFIKKVLEALYPGNPEFSMDDILKFLEQNPGLEKINSGIIRNEGYLKSINKDT